MCYQSQITLRITPTLPPPTPPPCKESQSKEGFGEIKSKNTAEEEAVAKDNGGRSKGEGRQVLTGGYVTGHAHL